jgi:dihydrofolate reductase
MIAIAVVDENWSLGKDGKLLVHLSGDLKYFKEKTIGKTIIMGRKTFEGMGGRLLPGRETVILSGDPDFDSGCKVCRSLFETFEYLEGKRGEDLFAAGGEAVYKLFLPYCDTFFITKIFAAYEADRHFPNLDERPDCFSCEPASDVIEENGVRYQFFKYTRKQNGRDKRDNCGEEPCN